MEAKPSPMVNTSATKEIQKRALFRPKGERGKVKTKHSQSLDVATQNDKDPTLANNNSIDENIAAIKEQVEIAIRNVDENSIDTMTVGQTSIIKDKAVILSWSTNKNIHPSFQSNDIHKDDSEEGIVFYVAIKMKSKINLESDEDSEGKESNYLIQDCSKSDTDDSLNYESINNDNKSDSEEKQNQSQSIDLKIEKNTNERETGSIRSALSRKQAKNNWLRLVTTMRNVNIAECENLFIKDEYRNIRFDEEDMIAVINGEYVVKTPPAEFDEDDTPSKRRVTWRESLEETFYDEEDCLIVDISDETGTTKLQYSPQRRSNKLRPSDDKNVKKGKFRHRLPNTYSRSRSQARSQESPQHIPTRITDNQNHKSHIMFQPNKSHSAPNSPIKSPLHKSTTIQRSHSAERNSISERRTNYHQHEYGEQNQNKVRRVRCRHSQSNEDMWLFGGPNSFNRRVTKKFVRNDISDATPGNQYYFFRSIPRASKEIV